ncbi:MAG: ribbon-helix-helix domain-containing protein [Nanoarchaeota archaeon]|nr:ribbon-helix-helix domain-containing protein [Nanoarchaeota archaeon]
MATLMVTFKIEHEALKEIDAVAKSGFYSRTEFIKAALRDKVEEARYRKAIAEIAPFKGIFKKKKTTEEEYERIREEAFEQLKKEKGFK